MTVIIPIPQRQQGQQHTAATSSSLPAHQPATPMAPNQGPDDLVQAAANSKPSLVRSLLAQAPDTHTIHAAVKAAAGAGDAYTLEILLQHEPQLPYAQSSGDDALHEALLLAASKGHAGTTALLLKQRPRHFPSRVIQAAMGRALQGDHAAVLQALLDRAKPDPYVRIAVNINGGDEEEDEGAEQTPIELAAGRGSQRCVAKLKGYEAVWRQHTLQLLIHATLADSCRLSTLPFAVVGTVLLECLAGRGGAHSIDEPARKRGLDGEEEGEEDDEDEEEEDEEEFPTVAFLHKRKRRKPSGGSGRRHSSGSGGNRKAGVVVPSDGQPQQQQPQHRRVLRPRKPKTWAEMRGLSLPSDSFTGACAF
jgi:hypothetical protein